MYTCTYYSTYVHHGILGRETRGRCQHRRHHRKLPWYTYGSTSTAKSAARISITILASMWACTRTSACIASLGRSQWSSASAGSTGGRPGWAHVCLARSRQSVEPVHGPRNTGWQVLTYLYNIGQYIDVGLFRSPHACEDCGGDVEIPLQTSLWPYRVGTSSVPYGTINVQYFGSIPWYSVPWYRDVFYRYADNAH